jgi:hypothetical protein
VAHQTRVGAAIKAPVAPQPVIDPVKPNPPLPDPPGGTGFQYGTDTGGSGTNGIGEIKPLLERHSYRYARFDINVSGERFTKQSVAYLDTIEALQTSAKNIQITVVIEASGGKRDDLKQAKELFSQYGIDARIRQE